jgi:hypothetical protein
VVTGKPLVFKMRLKNMTQETVRNLNAGIAIFSLTNLFMTSVSAQEGGLYSFDVVDECVVTLRVPRVSLNQGEFYLNCVVRSAVGGFEYDDLIENAKRLSVDFGDFHGIGQSSGGLFSLEHISSVDQLTSNAARQISEISVAG